MSITRIVKVPSDLPYAYLYLDDVEQICCILHDALRAESPEKPIVTTFSTKDLRMDSIEDLEKHGRSATTFSVKVRLDYRELSLELRPFSEPEIRLHTLDSESEWATYSKVKAIFDARQLTIKNAVSRLPEWSKFSLWIFAVFIVPTAFEVFRTRWFVDLAYLGTLGVVFFIMVRPSRVFFVHSHEQSKLTIENRKSYIKAIILLCIGAVIGKVLEIATRWIKAH
jgi:hypothetical protein